MKNEIENTNKENKSKIEKLKKEVDKLKNEVKQLNDSIQGKEDEINDKENKIEKVKEDTKKTLEDLDNLRNESLKYDKKGELKSYNDNDIGPLPSKGNNINDSLLTKN